MVDFNRINNHGGVFEAVIINKCLVNKKKLN